MSQVPGITVGALLRSRPEALGLTIEMLAGAEGAERLPDGGHRRVDRVFEEARVRVQSRFGVQGPAFVLRDRTPRRAGGEHEGGAETEPRARREPPCRTPSTSRLRRSLRALKVPDRLVKVKDVASSSQANQAGVPTVIGA